MWLTIAREQEGKHICSLISCFMFHVCFDEKQNIDILTTSGGSSAYFVSPSVAEINFVKMSCVCSSPSSFSAEYCACLLAASASSSVITVFQELSMSRKLAVVVNIRRRQNIISNEPLDRKTPNPFREYETMDERCGRHGKGAVEDRNFILVSALFPGYGHSKSASAHHDQGELNSLSRTKVYTMPKNSPLGGESGDW